MVINSDYIGVVPYDMRNLKCVSLMLDDHSDAKAGKGVPHWKIIFMDALGSMCNVDSIVMITEASCRLLQIFCCSGRQAMDALAMRSSIHREKKKEPGSQVR